MSTEATTVAPMTNHAPAQPAKPTEAAAVAPPLQVVSPVPDASKSMQAGATAVDRSPPISPVTVADPEPALAAKVVPPADGTLGAGEPVKVEIARSGESIDKKFADVLIDWGDGNKDDHLRIFRRGDRLVGHATHAFEKDNTYTVVVTDDVGGRVEVPVAYVGEKH